MNYNNQKIVKRIAEIEGLEVEECEGELLYWPTNYAETYDPINNAGQAMELFEKVIRIEGDITIESYEDRIDICFMSNSDCSYDFVFSGSLYLTICLAYLASKGEDLTQFEEGE